MIKYWQNRLLEILNFLKAFLAGRKILNAFFLPGILSRDCCPSGPLADTYPVAMTPPCGKNVQQRPLVIGANAIGVFSSRAQILRSLDEKEKHVCTLANRGQTPGERCNDARESPLLPVIRHRGQVQALWREAHRPQGADVDVTVIHGGLELGVAEEKETGQ